MGLDLRLQQKLAHQLVMTPQLQQAIKLLQLSHLEMAAMLRQEMESNPLLEERDGSESPAATDAGDAAEPLRAVSLTEGPEIGDLATWQEGLGPALHEPWHERHRLREGQPLGADTLASSPQSLIEHLRWQLIMGAHETRERNVALFLIDAIDDDGYLAVESLEAAEVALDATPELVAAGKALIEELDPAGVGATSLKECLALQARRLAVPSPLLLAIIEHHLPAIERRQLQHIARALEVSLDDVIVAMRKLALFDPKPGRRFVPPNPQYITPDLFVSPDSNAPDGWAIAVNDEGMPRLKLNEHFGAQVVAKIDGATQTYIQERHRSATWLLRSVSMRRRTIIKVMRSLLHHQRAFFEQGPEHLKPLVLRDVAQDVGMHESTISRVTTNKYVMAPQGLFELKFFFNSKLGEGSGQCLGSESVRTHIERLVGAESPDAPLSDQQLVELLAAKDIAVARRTVAKYREMLRIPPSSRRRRMF